MVNVLQLSLVSFFDCLLQVNFFIIHYFNHIYKYLANVLMLFGSRISMPNPEVQRKIMHKPESANIGR